MDAKIQPPAALAAMDPGSVEAIEWALWCSLMCLCDKCEEELETPDWSGPPWNGDVSAWAKVWAPTVQALGWSMAPDCFNLLCPKCQATPAEPSGSAS